MSSNDPTDHALATIASILEFPETHREPEKAPVEEKPAAPEQPITADGYSRIGPGPLPSLRFKWTVRREDNGEYYVDETIGETAVPVVNGSVASGCRDQAGGRSRQPRRSSVMSNSEARWPGEVRQHIWSARTAAKYKPV